MVSEGHCSTGDILAAIEAELVELLQSIAGEQGLSDGAEAFEEKMARLVCLLPKYFDAEERRFPSANPDRESHIQAHNQMLEHCVQWHLDLMQGERPLRSAICAAAQGWLVSHFGRAVPRS